jgi:hypothetical protein
LKLIPRHIIFLLCISALGACSSCTRQKKLNKYISLWRGDKIPYGSFYAFENLSALFPNASIHTNAVSPKTFYYDAAAANDSESNLKAYIILSPSVIPDSDEVSAMINFAGSGHQVFISALHIGDGLLKALHVRLSDSLSRGYNDSLQLSLYEPVSHDPVSYVYPGYCLDSYFISLDTAHTQVLGRNFLGKPDFIRIAFRHGGSVFIQLAPLAFSNFFLLHRGNRTYYDFALSYLPVTTSEVLWDDYFRYRKPGNFSALHFILDNRSLRWAFWLTILLFSLLYLFESKRKQRAIPVISPAGNASVDFVKTVGRLYFQQKNNQNLALKMIAGFLEHIRTKYHIPTAELNDAFSAKLAQRSGKDREEIRRLVSAIHASRMQPEMSDTQLMDLQQQMELFNKSKS